MLQIDSIDQNDLGLSELFSIIHLKKVSFCQKIIFASSRCFKNGLQGIFQDVFYTKPNYFFKTKRLETSKLSGKVKI